MTILQRLHAWWDAERVERVNSRIMRFAGTMPPGVYPDRYLDDLRDEWER